MQALSFNNQLHMRVLGRGGYHWHSRSATSRLKESVHNHVADPRLCRSWYTTSVPAEILDEAHSIARVLRTSRAELASILSLHPNIAIYTPEVLETTIEALADSLQLQRVEVLSLVKHQPLYLVQPHLAKQNLLAYPEVLGTPLPEVIRALRSCPASLALDPASLKQHLSNIARTFALSEPEAVQAVLQQPELLQYTPQELQQRVDQLQELLHYEPLAAQQLALKLPSALDLQPHGITTSLHLIQDLLQASAQEAVAVAVACPRLLLLEPRQLQMLVAQASSVFVALLGRQGALRVLVARGELLQLPGSVLHNKWQLLDGLCSTAPAWAGELRGLAAPEVAELMVQDYRCMARLRYLADMGQQSQCPVAAALMASEELFSLQYPGYQDWLKS